MYTIVYVRYISDKTFKILLMGFEKDLKPFVFLRSF